MGSIRYVGMDVDKLNIDLAVFDDGAQQATVEKRIPNDPQKIAREMESLKRGGWELRCCYEAGPCGYELKRLMDRLGHWCAVVAPGLIPQRPSDHVKTNRRDAVKLARMLRAGEIEAIHVPTPQTEAVRDFVRLREDVKDDRQRCRQRLSKFLLRHGQIYPGKAWSQRHLQWMKKLTWEEPALKATFDQYLYAVSELDERIRRCDAQIGQYADQDPWRGPVGRLRCFRGIDTLTGLGIMSEIEDFRRFAHASSLMGYLGFGVIEASTGDRRITGGITKAGNTHVRRLLVEAAWHCRHKPAVGVQLRRRRQGQPESVILIADKAMHRLQRRFLRLVARGKDSNKAVVAVARELAGFLWACEVEHAARSGGSEVSREKETPPPVPPKGGEAPVSRFRDGKGRSRSSRQRAPSSRIAHRSSRPTLR